MIQLIPFVLGRLRKERKRYVKERYVSVVLLVLGEHPQESKEHNP